MRDIEREFTDLCLMEGVGLTPWGPLGGGFLTGKYQRGHRPTDPSEGRVAVTPDFAPESWERRAIERNWQTIGAVEDIAKTHAATPSQVALAWLLRQPAVASVIVGVRTMEQLEDNLGAATLKLSADELDRLSDASALSDEYPYDYLRDYAQR
jgi:aryl-alcohol dehydrogenase-like predicted oxidoreductase